MGAIRPLESLNRLTTNVVQDAQDAQSQVKQYAYSTWVMQAVTLGTVLFIAYKISTAKRR